MAQQCPYGVLFAASLTARPPYAVYLPHGNEASPHATRLELTLFGPACPHYPWVLACLQEALRRGLGKARETWEIDEVRRVRPDRALERLAGADLSALPPTLSPDSLDLAVDPSLDVSAVEVDLLSPARLLRDGKMIGGSEPVPFQVLVARILDRFASLYGQGSSEILQPAVRSILEAEAAGVPLLAERTRWIEVRDYSARSGAEMLLGGKVGRLVYGGQAGRYLPLLRAGETLHLGKNTASGCGRIRVNAVLTDQGGISARAQVPTCRNETSRPHETR